MAPNDIEKELNFVKTEISALKITLIGIDGKNGMRNQISGLLLEFTKMKDCFSKSIENFNHIKFEQEKLDLIYATKDELKSLEDRIIEKFDELSKAKQENEKEKEKRRTIEKKNQNNLRYTRYSLILATVALILKEILPLLKG